MDTHELPRSGEALGPLEVTITAERVRAYADASGDHNPIHLDAAFAATTEFGKPIAHGMLLLAYLSRLLGARFGRAWLESGTLDAKFRAPATVGGRVVVRGEVLRVDEAEGGYTVACAARCEDADGQPLVTATARLTMPAAGSG